MAVSNTWSVTPTIIVTQYLPDHNSYSDGASQSINNAVMTQYINQHAGRVNALLARHSIDQSQVGDDEAELIKLYIITSTVASIHAKLQRWDAMREYRGLAADYWTEIQRPENLGDAQGTASTVHSNVPTDSARLSKDKDKFIAHFKGW